MEKVVNKGGVEKRVVLHRVCNRLPTGWQGWFWLDLQGFVVVVHSFHRAYYYVYYSPYSYLTLSVRLRERISDRERSMCKTSRHLSC